MKAIDDIYMCVYIYIYTCTCARIRVRGVNGESVIGSTTESKLLTGRMKGTDGKNRRI